MSKQYWHLYPQSLGTCTMEKGFFGGSGPDWLCTGCAAPRPEVQSVDVCIQERRLNPKAPLSFVFGYGVGIAHLGLLDELGIEQVASDLWLGVVLDDERRPFKDWVTLRGRQRAIIRGSKDVSNRICQVCGRNIYYAGGKRYLYPEPKSAHQIIETDLRGLLVPPEILPQGLRERWPKLGIETLSVRLAPEDGLGQL